MIWISQILTIVFAIGFAWQQSKAIKMFIDYVPPGTRTMKDYHRGGFVVAVLFIIAASLIASPWYLHIVINALWYWLVFDTAINKLTGKSWDYIGSEAWIDKQLNSIFTNGDAGEAKAVFVFGVNVILNIVCSHSQFIG